MEAADSNQDKENHKPCRACTDFKSWAKGRTNPKIAGNDDKTNNQGKPALPNGIGDEPKGKDCPLDKDSLGRNTWSFLHTMAAYYPTEPTPRQEKEMTVFIKLFSKFYPCDHCAEDFREEISKCPPKTSSRFSLSRWFCHMHNIVNKKLGKEEFDCKLVDERWRDGWATGECDS